MVGCLAIYLAIHGSAWQWNVSFSVLHFSGTPGALVWILPILVVYHITRILAAAGLLVTLSIFLSRFLKLESISARRTFLFLAFCSGVGWLAFPFGAFTSDFWVAEAYPFLSAYANPHFPLGLSLLLGIIILVEEKPALLNNLAIFLLSLILVSSCHLPLSLVGCWSSVWWCGSGSIVRCLPGKGSLLFYRWGAFRGLPAMVSQTYSVLQGWIAQNLTPSPPIWDFILSFSPIFLLAFVWRWTAWHSRQDTGNRLLILWFILGFLLIYFPFPLQRRFMLGFYIPAACLGVIGLQRITRIALENGCGPLHLFPFHIN